MDGQSYLLLIRDEGGPPEAQVRVLGTLFSHKHSRISITEPQMSFKKGG